MARSRQTTATASKPARITTENCATDDNGQFLCPECNALMQPMLGSMAGKGWNCSRGKWNRDTKRVDGCQGRIYGSTRSPWQNAPEVVRADRWPIIATPTDQQNAIRAILSQTPAQRGGRMLLIDACAGSGKTTTVSWSCEAIYKRVGLAGLSRWALCAFNVNAKTALLEKTPALLANVLTINGFGGRTQGYSFKQYQTGKLFKIFQTLTDHIEPKKRPHFSPIKPFAERLRDSLLIAPRPDSREWPQYIASAAERFPSLAKILEKKNAAECVAKYLPEVLLRAAAQGSTIDLSEQYSRPATNAILESGWTPRPEWLARDYEWTDADISHLCRLVRAAGENLPEGSVIVDEAQDLSLSQLILFLAVTYRSGELVLIGDDYSDEPGREKAGQGIFRWRGANGGIFRLASACWKELTGERAVSADLTVNFRSGPEVCEMVRPLNATMVSALPRGYTETWQCPPEAAFQRWLDLPTTGKDGKPYRALWLTRRNAPLGFIFRETIRQRRRCCIRGGSEFMGSVDSALYECAGWRDERTGEYKKDLAATISALRAAIAKQTPEGEEDPTAQDSIESFLVEIAEEMLQDSSCLVPFRECGATTDTAPTVGNLRRMLEYCTSKDAERVLSTIYRAKGDEAHLAIISDCEAFCSPWNNDTRERDAVCFTAGTRGKEVVLVCGAMPFNMPPMMEWDAPEATGNGASVFSAIKAAPAALRAVESKPTAKSKRKPAAKSKADPVKDTTPRVKAEPMPALAEEYEPSKAQISEADTAALVAEARAALARKDGARVAEIAARYRALTGQGFPINRLTDTVPSKPAAPTVAPIKPAALAAILSPEDPAPLAEVLAQPPEATVAETLAKMQADARACLKTDPARAQALAKAFYELSGKTQRLKLKD